MGQHTTQPSQHQVEALMQIGGYLHDVRESQLLSLEQIATQTMIQARLLRAIETADFHQLPEPIYIRGFIRRYAENLGLNGSEIADQFPVELDKRAIQPSWTQTQAQLRPTHLWLAYTLIIIVAIGGLHQYLTRFYTPASQSDNSIDALENSSDEADSTTASVTPPDSGDRSASPSSQSSADSTAPLIPTDAPLEQPEPDSPLKVTIELTQRSWLRVVVDGKQELEEVLPEGTQRSWTGNQEITVRAGNAGGVLLARDDGEASLMGEPGAVEEVTFAVEEQDTNVLDSADASAVSNQGTTTSSPSSQ